MLENQHIISQWLLHCNSHSLLTEMLQDGMICKRSEIDYYDGRLNIIMANWVIINLGENA